MYNHEPKDYKCPFCAFAQGQETEMNKRTDIIFEDDFILAFISPKWWVNNSGNVIIIPKQHVENIYDISNDVLGKIYKTGKQVALAIKQSYKCDGVSFRQHNEPAGNQDVWHFHLHVFPRWENDCLYLNYENKKPASPSERLPYAEKLKKYFQTLKDAL